MDIDKSSPNHLRIRRVHSVYQFVFLFVDFCAALLFVVGSVLFFYPGLTTTGTWFFLVGSICFAIKPTLRLSRFLHLRSIARAAELSLERVLGHRHFF